MRFIVGFVVVVSLAGCRPPGWDRRDDGVDAAAGIDAPTVDAAVDAVSTCSRQFRLEGRATATSVYVTGSFNSWAASPPSAVELAKGIDGAWTGEHAFPAGLHQYKFIVDNSEWIPDPTNPDGVDDGFGGTNSLYTCVP